MTTRPRWNTKKSFICMCVTRVMCKGMTIDQAIQETIDKGHCRNPQHVTDEHIASLRLEVEKVLKKIKRKSA